MEMQWLADMDTRLRLLLEDTLDIFEFRQSSKEEEFKILFESLAALVNENCVVYPDINKILTEALLNEACASSNNQDFKQSLRLLKEMYRPIEEMKRYGKHRPDILRNAECFENDLVIQTARTESLQSIHRG